MEFPAVFVVAFQQPFALYHITIVKYEYNMYVIAGSGTTLCPV